MEKNKNTCVHYSRHKAEFVYKLKTNALQTLCKTSGSSVGADASVRPPHRPSCYVPVGADGPVAVPKIFALPYGERLKF